MKINYAQEAAHGRKTKGNVNTANVNVNSKFLGNIVR
jgi:hypothetical protein